MRTLAQLAADLEAGRQTSRALVEECLQRIADPQGEGPRAFLKIDGDGARAAADFIDRMRKRGGAPSRFAGIPISLKDLFDVAGEVTTAGSVVLRDMPPERRDATAVARLKAAGFIPIGRTNMTEFAFSGLGLNPHYGTPANPYDRKAGRIPGGSSSGAAVSITDQMAFGAIGTDTGGSCRIPAALTGIVGFKPTASRVPLTGVTPLSPSLDSVGPLAASVACCAALDAVMAAEEPEEIDVPPVRYLRLAVPQTLVLDAVDRAVSVAFERTLQRLSAAGAVISEVRLTELGELAGINRKGGFPAAEAYAWHRARLSEKPQLYDPRVRVRILRGREQDAADYIDLCHARRDLTRRVRTITAPFDAVVMPTAPMIAPTFQEVADDDAYGHINLLMLRNPTVANFLDRCAISIPCHVPGEAPVGFMLMGENGADRRLLAMAAAIEAVTAPAGRDLS